jgi:hypothetical protein
MCVQWCVLDPGVAAAGGVPVEGDEDGDELGDDDDDVAAVVDVVVAAADPPVDASATPVAPAPTPAATNPVMMSRRVRPPVLETIGFLPSRRPSAFCGTTRRQGSGCVSGLPGTRNRTLSRV